jgi:serine-type D-Ala-D-Ala carboxypeptidase/endopeptidase (penicillin-binding protein 4)
MRSLFVCALLLHPISLVFAQDKPLAVQMDSIIDGPNYVGSQWGVLVVDTKTGETIYARDPQKLIMPASVTKLYSCAAAMLAYGADYKFETPLFLIGNHKDGKATGNLVLVSKGDPMFGSRTNAKGEIEFRNNDHTYFTGKSADNELTDTDPRYAFDDLAKQVKAAGIKCLEGDVLIDARIFQATRGTGSGPGSVTPIVVNDNIIDVIIQPGAKKGDPAKVTIRPETAFIQKQFTISTSSVKSSDLIRVEYDTRKLTVSGSVSLQSKTVYRTAFIDNPAELARAMLIEALQRQGITVTAALLASPKELPAKDAYKELKPLAVHTSAPLKELLKVTLKVSHNLYATTLPLLVGAKAGLTTEAFGLQEQGRLLKKLGVPIEKISFAGGAGGANADRVTPEVTVALLKQLQARPDWQDYKACLPILGVDGTLATVVDVKSPARGKVFAKTGTLYEQDSLNGRSLLTSKAIAGVMTTQSGRDLTFAMFVNDVPLPAGEQPAREGKVLGKLAELVYLHTPPTEKK